MMRAVIGRARGLGILFRLMLCFSLIAGLAACHQTAGYPSLPTAIGFSPEQVADQIHHVLAADRTAYAKYVVERARFLEGDAAQLGIVNREGNRQANRQASGGLDVSVQADWERRNSLPLPSHFFNLARDLAAEDGNFTYGLISPWALDDARLPQAEFDQEAVAQVVQTNVPYRAYRTLDGRPYFSAFYPDRAVVSSCVRCHNRHPEHRSRYPEKRFELGDVMGAMWINLPLDQGSENRAQESVSEGSDAIAPGKPLKQNR